MHFVFRTVTETSSLEGNIYDLDLLIGFVVFWVCFDVANDLHHVHSLDNSTKHRVLIVQPWL